MSFKDGDVVSAISGGPLMTVESTRIDDLIVAMWFDGDGVLHRDSFDPLALQKWQRVYK